MMEKLILFLNEAKRNTFASGKKARKAQDGSRVYTFERREYFYQDTYYGNVIDAGQEIVWYREKPVWSMVYRGGMIARLEVANECFLFLLKCLRLCPCDCPIRGPKNVIGKGFVYQNDCVGDIAEFNGIEWIENGGDIIYRRNYIGGVVKDMP